MYIYYAYFNPKEYTINTVVTDALTDKDTVDWYRFTVSNEGKYVVNITNFFYGLAGNNYGMKIYNSDLTDEKANLGWANNTGYPNIQKSDNREVFLSAGVYYIKVEGKAVKYSFSIKGATIEKTKVTKVKSPKKKKAEVIFRPVNSVNGYQIQYSTDKNFKKNVKSKSFTIDKTQDAGNGMRKVTISKLKRQKKYYFRIRTYIENNNSRYYSDWSKAKNVKIK